MWYVPLTGAGKNSGVAPYKIALNMDWKKYTKPLMPMYEPWELTAVKVNSIAPKRPEDRIIEMRRHL